MLFFAFPFFLANLRTLFLLSLEFLRFVVVAMPVSVALKNYKKSSKKGNFSLFSSFFVRWDSLVWTMLGLVMVTGVVCHMLANGCVSHARE